MPLIAWEIPAPFRTCSRCFICTTVSQHRNRNARRIAYTRSDLYLHVIILELPSPQISTCATMCRVRKNADVVLKVCDVSRDFLHCLGLSFGFTVGCSHFQCICTDVVSAMMTANKQYISKVWAAAPSADKT